MIFELKGKIEFDPANMTKKHTNQSTWKKTVLVKFDNDLYSYYAWFIKKRFNLVLNKPIRGSHMTIINDIVDDSLYEMGRDMFNGKEITLRYDNEDIRSDNEGHWWIKSYSDDAHNIRSVMGLNPSPYFGLHITIGLATHSQLIHSEYIRECQIKGMFDGNNMLLSNMIKNGSLNYKNGIFR
jgi:hypothetical protein